MKSSTCAYRGGEVLLVVLAVCLAVLGGATKAIAAVDAPSDKVVRSAASGPWSSPKTWEAGQVPAAGARVLVRPGHRVVYDVKSDAVLRSVHVGGILSFAPDRDTRLDAGLIMVRPGEVVSEDGIGVAGHEHAHHHTDKDPVANTAPEPAIEIGTADRPIDADHTALIRLTYIEGMDKETCPALLTSGGRMDIFGAPMSRTWTKLSTTAKAGDTKVSLAETVTGWRPGDRVIAVTTKLLSLFEKGGVIEHVTDKTETEERVIKSIDGATITLDEPLKNEHLVEGEFAGEVANLSRNVVIESADPKGVRGHTMYHRGSTGSIAYAEFRHLGKAGVLGRYPIHFHEAGDSMRGSSVVGASVWDSDNRWVTVHGTDYLVVRDVVGYRSVGHGFFMEDGTEVYNTFDRNLAVQALRTKPLPQQVLLFDRNDGAGFWWANSLNSFTRNSAVECDQHGYRFEAVPKNATFDPVLKVRQPDGTKAAVDVRTLPFIRFEDNEAHSQRRFALNLGGIATVAGKEDYLKYESKKGADGEYTTDIKLDPERVKRGDVGGVGPDAAHPFVIKNFKVWTSHWVFHGGTPSVLIDGLKAYNSNYGIWRSNSRLNTYKNLSMTHMNNFDVFHPWGGNPSLEDDYDKLLKRKDDLPPATVVTRVQRTPAGELKISGNTIDNGEVTEVLVNGKPAKSTDANFAQWEITLTGEDAKAASVTASASDKAKNAEQTGHAMAIAPALVQSASVSTTEK